MSVAVQASVVETGFSLSAFSGDSGRSVGGSTCFWDCVAASGYHRDTLERRFIDFVDRFSPADPDSLVSAVSGLVRWAEADTSVFAQLTEIARKYLYDPDSPRFNEAYYLLFLEAFAGSPVLSESDRFRFDFLYRILGKNRPGRPAADFGYLTRTGVRRTLYRTPGDRLLLILYDPDCEHCRTVLGHIEANAFLRTQIGEKRLTVLALCVESDREVWDRTKDVLPAEWIVGFDPDGLLEKELYAVPALPALYLLGEEKTVLLKDTDEATVESFIRRLASNGE